MHKSIWSVSNQHHYWACEALLRLFALLDVSRRQQGDSSFAEERFKSSSLWVKPYISQRIIYASNTVLSSSICMLPLSTRSTEGPMIWSYMLSI
jgi:hypothetical protein